MGIFSDSVQANETFDAIDLRRLRLQTTSHYSFRHWHLGLVYRRGHSIIVPINIYIFILLNGM
jgi:hypothetical protein